MKNYVLSEVNVFNSHSASSGSNFWLENNGYMSDADWVIEAKQLCKGVFCR